VSDHDSDPRAETPERSVRLRRAAATVLVPTHERPRYSLVIGELSEGRRLLSDDTALLESVALMLARRIDAVRVTHERCERNLRENEISKLATEAELRALRAQLNPHFLFNALTTIGYLIQTAPERALETLLRLTGLLRAVLRAPTGEFVTIGEEMDLIESYLAIERARFEERLRVTIDVPVELHKLRIPPLVVQPLVENAIKHGIAPRKDGGDLIVTARIEGPDDGWGTGEREILPEVPPAAGTDSHSSSPHRPLARSGLLCISIRDTGLGVSDVALAQGRKRGVGLANVERRLECFYGNAASLKLSGVMAGGTLAEIRMPLNAETELLLESRDEALSVER
jgi:two-component system LytT family sensor kinase